MINHKEIANGNKKYCEICGKHYYNNGIMLMQSSICEECVSDIVQEECTTPKYEEIKEKIKNMIF